MSKSKDEHERQNAVRRVKAAELIAAKLRKLQRARTDAALLSSEQDRRAAAKPKKPPTKK
ncbi:MAG: hypothetical protein EOP90_09670 [Lysobacteraceae bacterium]|nr:MAG: hypothetical protein EOP90_09670 [Xanthomonadaceae bacterium]